MTFNFFLFFGFFAVFEAFRFIVRRPTDYKLNTRINLPKPLTTDEEFQCEIRKRKYLDLCDNFIKDSSRVKVNIQVNQGESSDQKAPGNAAESSDQKAPGEAAVSSDLDLKAPWEAAESSCCGSSDAAQTSAISNKQSSDLKEERKMNNFLNLSNKENAALKKLQKRIKNNEVVVTPTDKSGRFSIMTHKQYIEAGNVHTIKDCPISWDGVRYLKNQVNSHMWWLARIWSYSKHTDPDRMLNNLTVAGIDLPEMYLLTKDHKQWSVDSKKPVPTRPVLSGNCAINTHLSEMISELVEPMVLESNGAEVQSSEEVLAALDEINEHVNERGSPPVTNFLEKFQLDSIDLNTRDQGHITERGNARFTEHGLSCEPELPNQLKNISVVSGQNKETTIQGWTEMGQEIQVLEKNKLPDHGIGTDRKDGNMSAKVQDVSTHIISEGGVDVSTHEISKDGGDSIQEIHDDLDAETIDILTELGMEALKERQESQLQPLSAKSKITDFFIKQTGLDKQPVDSVKHLQNLADTARNKYSSSIGTLNERLTQGMQAGEFWAKSQQIKMDQLLDSSETVMQDPDQKPILFGCDVVALYPNLDPIAVAQVTREAVNNTKVKFSSVNFYFLIVYLVLSLGENFMRKVGLESCIAKKRKQNNVYSLAATSNRDMSQWNFSHIVLDEVLKKKLIGVTLQLMVLLMTRTTCYKFGGRVYRQKSGLGIGLRGSAALARLVMCTWDRTWGYMQLRYGLIVQLFCRYIDDIRLYLRPLLPGYKWTNNGWVFTQDPDDRSPETRTVDELNKSLNDTWSFLEFTTEQETQFNDAYLPTLDFATKVEESGYVKYKFYNKPMTSNLVLQNGTALSNGCVFSSLRQDLVRRLYNSDLSMGIEYRIKLVEDYIQLLTNSGHKFSYIKSIVLQALTKFSYMVARDRLPKDDKRYMPLHRNRGFRQAHRKMVKYTSRAVWYTQTDVKDKFRNTWKKWIRRRGNKAGLKGEIKKQSLSQQTRKLAPDARVTRSALRDNRITTAIFVPKTPGGRLANLIQDCENKQLCLQTDWSPKVLEKPGIQLARLFVKKFEMLNGCWRGAKCMCEGKGTNCTSKGVVYEAVCKTCLDESLSQNTAIYIGETARQIGTRAMEHVENASVFKLDSFILEHWMFNHATRTTPPVFKFKSVSKHNDALSRQVKEALLIKERGNLNRRNEYALNEIIKMESSRYSWDEAEQRKKEKRDSDLHDQCIKNFASVMKNVSQCDPNNKHNVTLVDNGNNFYRLLCDKRKVEGAGYKVAKNSKRRRLAMDTSTPYRERAEEEASFSPESSPISWRDPAELSDSLGLETGVQTHKKTGLSRDTDNMHISEEKNQVSLVEAVAKQVVAVSNMQEAEINYSARTGGVTIDQLERINWEEDIRFKCNDSDSRSFEIVDLLGDTEDLMLGWLFNSVTAEVEKDLGMDFWGADEYCLLQWLFNGHQDFFEEEDINQIELEELIVNKKKNNLYELFLRENKLPATFSAKRKHSPEEIAINKLRRMTINTDSSPALRKPKKTVRRRTESVGGKSGVIRQRDSQLDPRQQLLSKLWSGNKRKTD